MRSVMSEMPCCVLWRDFMRTPLMAIIQRSDNNIKRIININITDSALFLINKCNIAVHFNIWAASSVHSISGNLHYCTT